MVKSPRNTTGKSSDEGTVKPQTGALHWARGRVLASGEEAARLHIRHDAGVTEGL